MSRRLKPKHHHNKRQLRRKNRTYVKVKGELLWYTKSENDEMAEFMAERRERLRNFWGSDASPSYISGEEYFNLCTNEQ